jgi:2-polyprenyl-3-methyl-5-hydroxy-6-metoxy-1,4-benzoquinol methylase
MKNKKFNLQNFQYVEPYHHWVSFDDNFKQWKSTSYGFEYYSYVSRIIEIVSKINFNNALEVGCGDGKILFELAKRNKNKRFTGFDLSKRAILFAKAYSYGLSNISFFDCDFSKKTAKHDLVLCVEVLEHIHSSKIKGFLEDLYNKLSPKGTLIISVPSVNIKPVQDKHYRHYDLKKLNNQLKDYFSIVDFEYIYKRNFITKCLEGMIENKIFINKSALLSGIILFFLNNFFIKTDKQSGRHILVTCKKK